MLFYVMLPLPSIPWHTFADDLFGVDILEVGKGKGVVGEGLEVVNDLVYTIP